MSTSEKLSEEIDLLLERYLHLLDQYTNLRQQLAAAQSSIQQHLARANFTAERGVRYGQDQYDERMQATRFVQVDENKSTLSIVPAKQEDAQKELPQEPTERGEEDTASKEKQSKRKPKDPIRMFGILVPQALRQAQSQAVKLVEQIVPELANINQEMERTEIEIRRKRKHKLKAVVKRPESADVQAIQIEGTA